MPNLHLEFAATSYTRYLLAGMVLLCYCCGSPALYACNKPYKTMVESVTDGQPIAVDLLRKVIDAMHCDLTILVRSSSHERRMQMIRDGVIDVLPESSLVKEREPFAWFSHPYRTEKIFLYVRRSDAHLFTQLQLNDISQQRWSILVPAGGWLGRELEQKRQIWAEQKLLRSYGSFQEGLSELRAGRATLMISSDLAFNLSSPDYNDIVRVGEPLYVDPVAFLLSRKTISKTALDEFNAALDSVLAH